MSSHSVPPMQVKEGVISSNEQATTMEECPICLDPVMDRAFLPCCGKQICPRCYTNFFTQMNQATSRINDIVLAQVVQRQGEEKVDHQDVAEELAALELQCESNSKCPKCRQTLPKDEHEVFQLVQRNAKQHGRAWAQFQLGRFHERGIGTPINLKLAIKWYRKAAEQGEQAAQHEYGICLESGTCGVTKNVAEACKWYEKAIASGQAESMFQLGRILMTGRGGVPMNVASRILLYKQAAEQGCGLAQSEVADWYETGEAGIGANVLDEASRLERALYWNEKAAKQGVKEAMANYARNLLSIAAIQNGNRGVNLVGHNVVPEALYWARKSAASGCDGVQAMVNDLENLINVLCACCWKSKASCDNNLKKCTRCQAIWYCGTTCQKAHWKAGHKKDCFDVAKADRAFANSQKRK